MHRTLRWREVGIETNLRALRDGIVIRRARLPPENTHEIRMMELWLSSIENVLGKIVGGCTSTASTSTRLCRRGMSGM
ncbi:hypothetical protein [Methanofollis ethanolicus]|uniref:hypothetical protein n=1 Tax=Methanofollis ethanolicus TaxID=488124 RepID=UPI000832C044|nr:hypothetical protein [Methanofollis ethanolicus]